MASSELLFFNCKYVKVLKFSLCVNEWEVKVDSVTASLVILGNVVLKCTDQGL